MSVIVFSRGLSSSGPGSPGRHCTEAPFPGHVKTWSTRTLLYRDVSNMLKRIHYETHNPGSWHPAGILSCLDIRLLFGFKFQDERNQVLTLNVWLDQVRVHWAFYVFFFCIVKPKKLVVDLSSSLQVLDSSGWLHWNICIQLDKFKRPDLKNTQMCTEEWW